MPEPTRSDNLVLERLREIRDLQGEMQADLKEVLQRLGTLEEGYASLSRRLDRVGGDIGRIKRRLELADAPAGEAVDG